LDFAETNTFGGNPIALKRYGLEGKTEEMNSRAAEIAREVCPEGKFVAGSIGPTTQMLEPYGEATREQMEECFAMQARGLASGGADVIIIETQTDIGEAECAFAGVRRETDIPIIVTMTFNTGKKGYRTMMGVSPEQVVERFFELGALAVGTNCSLSMGSIITIIEAMHAAAPDKSFMAQPNAGSPKLINGETVYGHGPDDMGAHIDELAKAGAQIIGGCCGTTPAHIKKFRSVIDAL